MIHAWALCFLASVRQQGRVDFSYLFQAFCLSEARLLLPEHQAGKETLYFSCCWNIFGMKATKKQQMCSLAVLCAKTLLRVELTLKFWRTRTDSSVSFESMGFSHIEKFRGWREPIQASGAEGTAHHIPQGWEGVKVEFLVQTIILELEYLQYLRPNSSLAKAADSMSWIGPLSSLT